MSLLAETQRVISHEVFFQSIWQFSMVEIIKNIRNTKGTHSTKFKSHFT